VFSKNNRVELIIRPDPKAEDAAEATKDSAKKAETLADFPMPKELPSGKAPGPVDLPRPLTQTLPNGLTIAVFSDASTPAVTISYNMLIGSKDDPPEQSGLASVTSSTLRRGTKKHTGLELAQIIDSHAMSLSDMADDNNIAIRLWTLSEYTDLGAEILAEVVREPVFPEDEVKNYLGRAITSQKIDEQDASVLADRAFNRMLYGDYYLSRPNSGTSKTLANITRDAIVGFHQKLFGPRRATLIFAGDIKPDRAFEIARRLFGDWKTDEREVVQTAPPAAQPRRVAIVDRPGAVQSEIRIGEIVPVSRRDADYAGVRLLSQLFGESFSGRLNTAIRIQRGLTYGARAYFDVDKETAAFKISTFTRTERTGDAVQAALEEVEKLHKTHVTQEELDAARDTLLGNFHMALETPSQIAARWFDLIVWGLPENWYSQYLQSVADARDPKAIDQVARTRLAPSRLSVVVAGDGSKLKEQLKPFGEVTSAPAE
jgi:zinc protease